MKSGARDTSRVAAPGETDLTKLLAAIDVVRRPGSYVYVVRGPGEPAPDEVVAMIDEAASISYVVSADSSAAGDGHFRAAWLTLTVNSSLDGVGLCAAVATALVARDIPANVLAGFYHDHLLVPEELADQAIAAIHTLRTP